MGKALQIRVSAVTWDEELLEKLWPRLTELAFSVPLKHDKRGVLEMVKSLHDGLRFMDWPAQRKEALTPGIELCADIAQRIEGSLTNWDPRKANALSDELELELDKLEAAYR